MNFKKTIVTLLAAVLLLGSLAGFAESENAAPSDVSKRVFGTLSMLNMTEEEYLAFAEARMLAVDQLAKEGYVYRAQIENTSKEIPADFEIAYYDTMDALLMALNAGQINGILIYQNVARYLCATNDTLSMQPTFNTDQPLNTFAKLVFGGLNGNDFSFLMMEDRTELQDEFNAAIAEMKEDGTLDRLVEEQIDALVDGGEIKPVALPQTDGAETIKVAVTGALPPMDYVAANGDPAGFNTAVLAEIAQRTGKNIELVVVDSFGRAAALASGVVDAVFWTRTSNAAQRIDAMTEDELAAKHAELDPSMTEEELQVMQAIAEKINLRAYGSADMPEKTICTDPYFSDAFVVITPSLITPINQ